MVQAMRNTMAVLRNEAPMTGPARSCAISSASPAEIVWPLSCSFMKEMAAAETSW